MIKESEDLDLIEKCAYGYLCESTASKFITYVKRMRELDWKLYLKDFTAFENLEQRDQYAVLTLIAKHGKEVPVKKLAEFTSKTAGVILEFSAIFLSLLKVSHGKELISKVIDQLQDKLVERIAYLVT